jgi:hypothetical protein
VLSSVTGIQHHMAGSYYTSEDVRWSNIRTAERREQAEWDAYAPERARALYLKERQQWCREEAAKKLALEVADEISRQEMLNVVRVNFNNSQELFHMDSNEGGELENRVADLIDDLHGHLNAVRNLLTGQVLVVILVWCKAVTMLLHVLDIPAVIGITTIVSANLILDKS